MKKPSGYLTTGEFAKICHVNKQTLFHYDQIGILQPELMGDNGYRYYSYLQLDAFNAIVMLKDLGMPLSEIREYLNNRTPQDFLELLHHQELAVDEKIEELKWLKKFISGRIDITQKGIDAVHDKIFLESRPEEYFIITKYSGPNEDPDIYATIAEHLSYCQGHQIWSPYAVGGLISTDSGPWHNEYEYTHFYTQIQPDDLTPEAKITTLPPRSNICICSTKGFDCVAPMLNKLMDYAKEHNFNVAPFFFEDMLLDDMSCFGFENYTLKISLPIIENDL